MSETGVELYRKHRPQKFSDLIGQAEAISALSAMGKAKEIPHALLLTGPSGCGKTTAARIIRRVLVCGDHDFRESNAASSRGIDFVRDIEQNMRLMPVTGKVRVFLIDECHALTGDAQSAFLKLLEDTPAHVYFILATTDPAKLKPTIKTRCTEVKFKAIPVKGLIELVTKTATAEMVTLDPRVAAKIADFAGGSGRKAMVLLHQVLRLPDAATQLNALEKADVEVGGFQIAQLLMKKAKWAEVAAVLATAKEQDVDPEAIRRIIIGYMQSVLLKGASNRRAFDVLDCFRTPTYDMGFPAVTMACYEATEVLK